MKKMRIKEKEQWLRKNNVILKKEKPRDSTIKRLYSFYQRNPLTTPRNLAYGLPKRVEKQMEKDGILETPKGKITSKKYIRKIDQKTQKEIKLPVNINIKYGHYYPSVKRMADRMEYRIEPHMIVHRKNIDRRRKDIYESLIPSIIEFIRQTLYRKRHMLYKNYVINARVHYHAMNVVTVEDRIENPTIFVTVGWSKTKNFNAFEKGLQDEFENALKTLYSVSATERSYLEFYLISIQLSSDAKLSPTDKLRIHDVSDWM